MGSSSDLRPYKLANPRRRIHPEHWYVFHDHPGNGRLAWGDYLCVDEEILEGLETHLRDVLKATGMHMVPLTTQEAQKLSRQLVEERVAHERPDICCHGIPKEGILTCLRKMVSRINKEDRALAKKEAEQSTKNLVMDGTDDELQNTEERGGKRRRIESGRLLRSSVTPANGFAKGSSPSEGTETINGTIEVITQRSLSGAHGPVPPNPESGSITSISQLTFDPELTGVIVRDPKRVGLVHASYLHNIAQHPVDILSCRGLEISRLHERMRQHQDLTGVAFFDPHRHYLWCKIGNDEYIVTNGDLFEIVCRWQIEAALKRDPSSPPMVEFERRWRHDLPSRAGPSPQSSGQYERSETSTCISNAKAPLVGAPHITADRDFDKCTGSTPPVQGDGHANPPNPYAISSKGSTEDRTNKVEDTTSVRGIEYLALATPKDSDEEPPRSASKGRRAKLALEKGVVLRGRFGLF